MTKLLAACAIVLLATNLVLTIHVSQQVWEVRRCVSPGLNCGGK